MGFLDKVREGAEQAATKAREELDDYQARRDLKDAYADLGQRVLELVEKGELEADAIGPEVERAREASAKVVAARASKPAS